MNKSAMRTIIAKIYLNLRVIKRPLAITNFFIFTVTSVYRNDKSDRAFILIVTHVHSQLTARWESQVRHMSAGAMCWHIFCVAFRTASRTGRVPNRASRRKTNTATAGNNTSTGTVHYDCMPACPYIYNTACTCMRVCISAEWSYHSPSFFRLSACPLVYTSTHPQALTTARLHVRKTACMRVCISAEWSYHHFLAIWLLSDSITPYPGCLAPEWFYHSLSLFRLSARLHIHTSTGPYDCTSACP